MSKINKLTIASAEAMALELADRDEKFAAQTIASLLAIIEELTPKHPHNPWGNVAFDLNADDLEPGSRIEHNGKSGTVVMVDRDLPDQQTGKPVVLVNWDAE